MWTNDTVPPVFAPPAAAQDVQLDSVHLADPSGSIAAVKTWFQRQDCARAITDPLLTETIVNKDCDSVCCLGHCWLRGPRSCPEA